MPIDNNTILYRAFLNGTSDYQQRIGDPTQQDISVTMENLFDPMNKQYYNQFCDFLVNRIGEAYARGQAFENPLAAFKGPKLNYGSTIEEYAPAWIKSHSYNIDNVDDIFKRFEVEGKAWFYTQNRQEFYPITINEAALKAAFVDEFGLNDWVAKIMQVPMNSDNYDEYRIMLNLIKEYDERWGFAKVKVDAIEDEDSGKAFLTEVRTKVGELQFPSTLYNCSELDNIPVFAKPSELVLFVTPRVAATLSVEVLADIFHIDVADMNVRQILVDQLPIEDAVALLTTDSFIVARDTLYENTSQYNPVTLATNYYLHHWGIYSPNPFVPAILFTEGDADVPAKKEFEADSFSLNPDESEVAPGGTLDLKPALAADASSDPDLRAPASAIYALSAYQLTEDTAEEDPQDDAYEPIQLNGRTYVDKFGVLHVQKSGWPSTAASGTLVKTNVIKVIAVSTIDSTLSDDVELEVTSS